MHALSLRIALASFLYSAFLHSAEGNIPCSSSTFRCRNGKCIEHHKFCDRIVHCEDRSDETYCSYEGPNCPSEWVACTLKRCIPSNFVCDGVHDCLGVSDEHNCDIAPGKPCPSNWAYCPNRRRCLPYNNVCDGKTYCPGPSEEKNCGTDVIRIPGAYDAESELRSWILERRKSGSRADRWGSQVHRIAVALHLSDNSTFRSENSTGQEIRNELRIQLLRRLAKDKRMSTQELALYVHALLVSCLDPKDFYGDDLVLELRGRVEATGNYTNPFQILVLCSAGDTMTARDVERVADAYNSKHWPFWTDHQALAIMAMSCISLRSAGTVDERYVTAMQQELKNRQFRNGTVENLMTTALVTQALLNNGSYKIGFNLSSAITAIMNGLKGNRSLLKAYYALPVLSQKSLLHATSSHCKKEPLTEEEAAQKASDVKGEAVTVQYSVRFGGRLNVAPYWRLQMNANSSVHDAIETVAKTDSRQKVEYSLVDGKPYVMAVNGIENDDQMGTYWFIYLKTLYSDEDPKLVEESPVDIKLRPNQEIILWYKPAPQNSQSPLRK